MTTLLAFLLGNPALLAIAGAIIGALGFGFQQRLAGAKAERAKHAAAEAAALDTKTLFALEQDLLNLADAIGSHYFPHGPNASRPEKLTGLA